MDDFPKGIAILITSGSSRFPSFPYSLSRTTAKFFAISHHIQLSHVNTHSYLTHYPHKHQGRDVKLRFLPPELVIISVSQQPQNCTPSVLLLKHTDKFPGMWGVRELAEDAAIHHIWEMMVVKFNSHWLEKGKCNPIFKNKKKKGKAKELHAGQCHLDAWQEDGANPPGICAKAHGK